jgi:hypothetical protein
MLGKSDLRNASRREGVFKWEKWEKVWALYIDLLRIYIASNFCGSWKFKVFLCGRILRQEFLISFPPCAGWLRGHSKAKKAEREGRKRYTSMGNGPLFLSRQHSHKLLFVSSKQGNLCCQKCDIMSAGVTTLVLSVETRNWKRGSQWGSRYIVFFLSLFCRKFDATPNTRAPLLMPIYYGLSDEKCDTFFYDCQFIARKNKINAKGSFEGLHKYIFAGGDTKTLQPWND